MDADRKSYVNFAMNLPWISLKLITERLPRIPSKNPMEFLYTFFREILSGNLPWGTNFKIHSKNTK